MSNPTSWERTPVQGLLRNAKSGHYYGRWKLGGKQKWVSLKTDVFSVAKLRMADESAKIARLRTTRAAVSSGQSNVGELIAAFEQRLAARDDLKESSKKARGITLAKIRKTWPELSALKPSQVTPSAISDWVTRFKLNGTGFVPPGAKAAGKGNSATSVNRAIDTLRAVLDIAVHSGAIAANPVTQKTATGERLKKKITKKQLVLPSASDVRRLFDAMENNGAPGGWGREAADLCRFMAFSGARLGEANLTTWSCVDWERRQVTVPGYKSESSARIVPMFADLEALLRRLIDRRNSAAQFAESKKPRTDAGDRLFNLSECQKTIDAACARLGIRRVTHHDFRHLFATVCIESGVDIPTVSRWLGHADGGALAMKTYGHLRQEHSHAQAAKVNFGGAS